MKKLHVMMPMYAQAQARILAAIVEKDARAVEREVGKVLVTIPDLKRASPHKNLKELKTMRKLASSFEGELKTTVNLSKKGDFKGVDAALARAVKRCDQCHARFRD